MWSPSIRGNEVISRDFNAVSVTDRYGKKATPPCPCGYLGHWSGQCSCTPDRIARYRERISGPLLDRIDLHVEVPALRERELADGASGEPSAQVRARVEAARERQMDRQGAPNGRLEGGAIERRCVPSVAARKLLRDAASRLSLSARGYHRVLKVARTIADLAGHDDLGAGELAEALQYRPILRTPATTWGLAEELSPSAQSS
jgi:magnesium chelatase family protein